jgi:hypothetical protein
VIKVKHQWKEMKKVIILAVKEAFDKKKEDI